MTRHHSDLVSVLTLHHHMEISVTFRAFNEPNPSPLGVFGATTFSHYTQLILFLFSSPPHTNLLLIFSKILITPVGATKIEKKYVGILPSTACASVTRPPNDKVFDFQTDNFDLNLSIMGCQFFSSFIFAPTRTPRYVKGSFSGSHPRGAAHLDTSC